MKRQNGQPMKRKINIPLIDLKREYAFLRDDIDKELESLFKNQKWILGPQVYRLEDRVSRYLNVKYALGVASGTDALLLSLRAFSLKFKRKNFFDSKDEIITTPFTFIATAEAILRAGARPVFVDIDPDTFNISPQAVKRAVTKNTVGIIPVHLYGLPADMDSIMNIARKYGLFVLEDTAQAFGAIYKGKKAGTIGTAGAFSFFPSKNLAGYGDAGLIATDDNAVYDYIKALRNHGQKEQYKADYLGYNSRLDSFQAAILSAKLKYIDRFNRKRMRVAGSYSRAFAKIKEIKTPFVPEGAAHIYHLYTIKVSSKRNRLIKFLNSKGIAARIYYPHLLNQMKAFKSCKAAGALKNARSVLSEVLTLPVHPFMRDKEVSYIVEYISKFFSKN